MMKKNFRILFICITIIYSNDINAQFDDLLNKINKIKTLQKEIKKEVKFVEVLNTVLETNSVSNARFKGGKNRVAIKLDLPEGTKSWYYRITVMELNDFFRLGTTNTLLYGLQNKQYNYNNRSTKTVDFYVIPESNVANFMQTGNDNYLIYTDYTKRNVSDYIGTSDKYNDDYWIGIKNNDNFKGVKVLLEVVALGIF